jgi:S-adenosyl-L-methionine hydrolase (adenosine-forming)
MATAGPLIAILTDFGTAGHYVASMKGVMLGICPGAVLVDITHEIPAHDVRAAGWVLRACVRDFPPGTVFLVVIDPGVGTSRRALAVEAGGYMFVGPDNGVLAPAVEALGPRVIVSLDAPGFARPSASRTFEGRDRFGPAAAWIAAGTPLPRMGQLVSGYATLEVPRPVCDVDRIRGEVVMVDRFGNLITNIERTVCDTAAQGRTAVVFLDCIRVGQIGETYGDVASGKPCALFGSTGCLEVAIREGSAAAHFGRHAGTVVDVVWDGRPVLASQP